MNNRTQVSEPDAEFLRNTGLGLVFLTLLAGSISLYGSFAYSHAPSSEFNPYGIEGSKVPELSPAN